MPAYQLKDMRRRKMTIQRINLEMEAAVEEAAPAAGHKKCPKKII